jgi:hypothetical protein
VHGSTLKRPRTRNPCTLGARARVVSTPWLDSMTANSPPMRRVLDYFGRVFGSSSVVNPERGMIGSSTSEYSWPFRLRETAIAPRNPPRESQRVRAMSERCVRACDLPCTRCDLFSNGIVNERAAAPASFTTSVSRGSHSSLFQRN